MRVGWLFVAGSLVIGIGGAVAISQFPEGAQLLNTGKMISPQGDQTEVGSFPVNMALSTDGRYIVVTDIGYREQLSILDASTGNLIDRLPFNSGGRRRKQGLYYGIAFAGAPDGSSTLYASRGQEDTIATVALGADGKFGSQSVISDPGPTGRPRNPAGLALSTDGSTLYAVNNESYVADGFAGSISVFDTASKAVKDTIKAPAFPIAIVAVTKGPEAGKKLYVSGERDGVVGSVDLATKRLSTISTGAQPAYLLLNPDQTRLFVSNSGSDTVSIIDTSTDKVLATVLLREGDLRGLPGSTPLGMALSLDGKTLFVALGDLNAVAVVALDHTQSAGSLAGFIDAGWYPTSLVVSPDGQRLFIANAKGGQAANPNGKDVRDWGRYIENIIEGTVTGVAIPEAMADLKARSQWVVRNNFAVGHRESTIRRAFVRPPVTHVVYIIKENRTYDQVLGDDPHGNGDPSLTLFGKDVTPNQHALADRFALMDNFFVCAEVSADGWNWSTSGMASAYAERNVPYNYSGRGRAYDFEGTNNGEPVKLEGLKDVNEAPGGYIWDDALKAGRSVRNYGFFVSFGPAGARPGNVPLAGENDPVEPSLVNRTDTDFRRFDTSYSDSDAWIKLGLKPAPRQVIKFGKNGDSCRFAAWLREFREQERAGVMPNLSMIRVMCDHTAGTSPGLGSPRAMVADNDYAVGEIVDAISHSKFWSSTAICVLEDDAQDGFDHVDAHRSPAYVISPYIAPGTVFHNFVNTDSMLRTMELLLGLKPMSQYDAIAPAINVFGRTETNAAPYDAILPSKEIIGEVNEADSYRSEDSAKLIDRFDEDSAPDMELNDILWGSIKGAKTPRPKTPGVIWRAP